MFDELPELAAFGLLAACCARGYCCVMASFIGGEPLFSAMPRALRCTIFAVGLSCAAIGQADDVDVVLLGGQSNMAGTGTNSANLPADLQSPQVDVLFYYHVSLPAVASLGPLRIGSGNSMVAYGPEITFGRQVASALPATNFALIKAAINATSLHTDWDSATGTSYATFRSTVADGIEALIAAGHSPRITGMLWTQGEQDAFDHRTAAQYATDLTEFIADVRGRYGADLRFFISRLSSQQQPGQDFNEIRNAQASVAASDPLTQIIDTDDLSVYGFDTLHFDDAGQQALGHAFASSYLQHLYQLGDFDRNGQVNHSDLTELLVALTDLSAYKARYSLTDPELVAIGDFNGSGNITNADIQPFLNLLSLSGSRVGGAVPEPSTFSLLAIGGICICLHRKRCLTLRPRMRMLSGAASKCGPGQPFFSHWNQLQDAEIRSA